MCSGVNQNFQWNQCVTKSYRPGERIDLRSNPQESQGFYDQARAGRCGFTPRPADARTTLRSTTRLIPTDVCFIVNILNCVCYALESGICAEDLQTSAAPRFCSSKFLNHNSNMSSDHNQCELSRRPLSCSASIWRTNGSETIPRPRKGPLVR